MLVARNKYEVCVFLHFEHREVNNWNLCPVYNVTRMFRLSAITPQSKCVTVGLHVVSLKNVTGTKLENTGPKFRRHFLVR